MKCITVLYPSKDNEGFNFDFYRTRHTKLIEDILGPSLHRIELRSGLPGPDDAMLSARTPEEPAADLKRCAEAVAALASGQYDDLGGRYLDIQWDLDAKAREARVARVAR